MCSDEARSSAAQVIRPVLFEARSGLAVGLAKVGLSALKVCLMPSLTPATSTSAERGVPQGVQRFWFSFLWTPPVVASMSRAHVLSLLHDLG